MRSDIHSLTLFLKAAQLGSFAATAAVFDMTPAAVGQGIKRLEERYNTKLFNRTTRTMSLTPSGTLLLKRASGPVKEINELEHVFSEQQGIASGTVRISAPQFFAKHYLVSAIAGLKKRYPQIEYHVDASDQRRDFVGDPVDLAIRMDKPSDSSLIARHIKEINTVTAASKEYIETFGSPKTPEQLTEHTCIAYRFPDSGLKYHWQFRSARGINSFEPQDELLFNDPEVCCEAASKSIGIIQLADIIVRPYLTANKLTPLLTDYSFPARSLYLCYAGREFNPLRLTLTVDFLLEYFKKIFQ